MNDIAQAWRPAAGLEVGDPAPAIALRDERDEAVALHADALGGDAAVVVFCRAADDPASAETLRALAASFAGERPPARVLVVTAVDVAANAAARAALGLPFALLADPGLAAWRSYGLRPEAAAPLLVVDHNRRFAAVIGAGAAAGRAAAARAAVDRLLAARPAAKLGEHPPVLILPRLLSPAECVALIEVWHRPVTRWTSDGLRSEGFANEKGDFKIRIDTYGKTDQFVIRDPAVLAHVDSRLARRVGPQIRKAFCASASYREDLRIACYDASEGGSLPAHRDNPTPATRHRVFTLSIHLNAGDYEGGGLFFPEYGEQRYEVERGTGIVWSCSLLHEVDKVTRGRRFILGTHFFNDLAAMQAATGAGRR